LTTFYVLDFTELIAEKIRALMSRGYPRDYYDVWAHLDKISDKNDLKELVKKKCLLVNLPYTPDLILEKDALQRAKAEWNNQLKHLIRDPVSFNEIQLKLEQELAFLN
jgi:predicted nucleotidyltransferase component of viral defense system